MSPERIISIHESNQLFSYIRGKKAPYFIQVAPEGETLRVAVAGETKDHHIDSLRFALVDGDPIVIYGDKNSFSGRKLLCSKKRLLKLEKAGIIKSSKPNSEK